MDDQQDPPVCVTDGCGFFASPSTANKCSKCFKLAQTANSAVLPATPAVPGLNEDNKENVMPSNDGLQSRGGQQEENRLSEENGACASSDHEEDLNAASMTARATSSRQSVSSTSSSESLKRKQPSDGDEPSNSNPKPLSMRNSSITTRASSANKKGTRCKECKKRVGLTGFKCRCDETFCAIHRYTDMHACVFDYKTMGAQEIAKNNPVVRGEKIRKL